MTNKSFKFLNIDVDSRIPLPDVKEIEKIKDRPLNNVEERVLNKHDQAYDDFCRWSSIPQKHRKPETQAKFEKKYKLPKNYCAIFKRRSDYYQRYYKYMFEWIRELYPEFIQNQYLQATKDGNPSAIRFFGEMVAKDMEVEKPRNVITPFMIIGVPQEKINKLFIPDKEDEIEEAEIEE